MNNIIWSFLSILMIFTLLFIYYFYNYLFKQYEKATMNYIEKSKKVKQYSNIKKQFKQRKPIKDNVTKQINSDSINKRVGYAIIEFLDEQGRVEKTQTIFKSNFSIGREESNDIVLRKNTISRRHCLIIYQDKKFYICNLSQTNPTMLNGISIENSPDKVYPLMFGNIIEMSDYSFRFENITKRKQVT